MFQLRTSRIALRIINQSRNQIAAMSNSTNQSHAPNPQTQSAVPEGVQRNVPEGLEKALPDSVHNTDPNKDANYKSHATGPSLVPEAIQKAAPEGLEKALPESIHPTNPK